MKRIYKSCGPKLFTCFIGTAIIANFLGLLVVFLLMQVFNLRPEILAEALPYTIGIALVAAVFKDYKLHNFSFNYTVNRDEYIKRTNQIRMTSPNTSGDKVFRRVITISENTGKTIYALGDDSDNLPDSRRKKSRVFLKTTTRFFPHLILFSRRVRNAANQAFFRWI
ncbi:MAG: hypothetical protein FWE27_04190 [Defluviitaleaceae bacterium]|nr:hypothetical protein [Defluviitaleaceae bacterium]